MIINMQAFNTSMKEGGKSKEARIIYDKRDEFGSRRPIDVIKAIIRLSYWMSLRRWAEMRRRKHLKTLIHCLH